MRCQRVAVRSQGLWCKGWFQKQCIHLGEVGKFYWDIEIRSAINRRRRFPGTCSVPKKIILYFITFISAQRV